MSALSNDEKVQLLIKQMGDSAYNLDEARGYLRMVIEKGSWKSFTTPNGNLVEHKRFADFVTDVPWRGLGSSVQDLLTLAGDDAGLKLRLASAVRMKQGERTDLGNNIPKVGRPEGTSEAKALLRLEKDRPDLLAQVEAKKMSAHKAMVEAGFRPRTFTVRADPESAAQTIKKQLTPEQIAQLKEML